MLESSLHEGFDEVNIRRLRRRLAFQLREPFGRVLGHETSVYVLNTGICPRSYFDEPADLC